MRDYVTLIKTLFYDACCTKGRLTHFCVIDKLLSAELCGAAS